MTFSKKQLQALTWWTQNSAHRQCDAIICDGAVRAGKTMVLSLSFVLWAMTTFQQESFALCGKTITALRRNLVVPLVARLQALGFQVTERTSKNYLDITCGGRRNRFYLFGGKDEGSAALIQGMTLGGILLDEVVLMPRSFVEQALARCSVTGSKFWFNCNPQHPYHWFYTEWIQKVQEKKTLYLHFTMADNPSLTKAIVRRYESLYSGSFYRRFVLGEWVVTAGLVYPQFCEETLVFDEIPSCSRFVVSCDYGTVNPTSMGLWGECEGRWCRLAEYYYDARAEGAQKTDEEYYRAMQQLVGDRVVESVVVDPSAASFIACIRRHGRFVVLPANNEVLAGIRQVSEALHSKKIFFHRSCTDCLREFSLYRWAESVQKDTPLKVHDHAMDDVRYFVSTILYRAQSPFFVQSTERGG